MKPEKVSLPLNEQARKKLKPGMPVLLSGTIYSARDAAHKKIQSLIKKNSKLPFPLKGASIYYVGPSPARPGKVIGSAGPTTSGRMDSFTPLFLDQGLKVMIGKGERSDDVKKSIRKNKAVYFTAIGGTAALLSVCILSSRVIAFPELGPEAVREMEIKDFPCYVKDM